MKKKLLFLLLAVALIAVFALAGCTESYKQEPIEGDYSNAEVIFESGIATELFAGGKYYLYFVNGVGGQTVEDNAFGAVVKGAVARVELDGKDGEPKLDTKTIVVPKNVFATEVDSSFRIRGGYIYYSTPSVLKDKDGKAKTSDMVLMRTSLDGTKTEIIKTFESDDGGFSNYWRVTKDEIIVYYQYAFSRIDLNSKNFETTEIVKEVASYQFVAGADYVLYTKANTNADEYSNRVLLLPFSAKSEDDAKLLIDKTSYDAAALLHSDGYKITLTASNGTNETLELFYTKADSGTTQLSAGIYRYVFDLDSANFKENRYAFAGMKEERITANGGKSYTAFHPIDDDAMYATDSTGIYFLCRDLSEDAKLVDWKILKEPNPTDPNKNKNVNIVVSGAKFFRYEEKDGKGTIYYFNSTKLQSRVVFAIGADGTRTISPNNSDDLYTIAATTSWLNYKLLGKNLYFINSGANNYVYFVDTSTFVPRGDAKTYSNILLSEMSEADRLTLINTVTETES